MGHALLSDEPKPSVTGQRLEPEQEIAKLKHAISALIPWAAGSGRGAAQEALADACELIGVDPLSWSAHPDVLLQRRPEFERRTAAR